MVNFVFISDYDANAVWGDLGEMDNDYGPVMDHSKHGHHGMHGMHHGMHGGHDMHGGHMMAMNFHANHQGVIYLFENAKIETVAHLWFAIFLTVALGIL